MAEGRCASFSKYVLVILNLLFWITGAVFLSLGIWLVANDTALQTVSDTIHLTVSRGHLDALGYTLIGAGFFLFLTGFLGCCGAIRESGLMLGVYLIFMTLLLIAELAAIVYVTLEKEDIESLIRNQLLSDVRNYSKADNESSVDFFQIKFECCGVDSYTNYRENPEFNISGVPSSCCQTNDSAVPANPVDYDQCQTEARLGITNGSQLHSKGCFQILKHLLQDNSTILIGVMSSILVLEVLGLLFAIYLCRNRTDYYYYDED